jgi:hypothetical protein
MQNILKHRTHQLITKRFLLIQRDTLFQSTGNIKSKLRRYQKQQTQLLEGLKIVLTRSTDR